MKSTSYGSLILLAAVAVAGCNPSHSGTGTVRGRVVDASGQPISGARVALDRSTGRTTLTNIRGEFSLGAKDGAHVLLAFSQAQNAAASTEVDVDDGNVANVGDVTLMDCDEVVPMPGEGGNGAAGDDGMTEPGDPTIPCEWEPPPPPEPHVDFGSLEAEFAAGFVDPWGVYGFGDDSSEEVGFDFWIPADITASGTFSGHVVNDYANGVVEAHFGLYTYEGHYYVLREGDLTVTVSEDGDGDPSTLNFSFSGTNLSLDYAGWEGIDAGYTASVESAIAEGQAWQYIPPPPPTEDVTLPTFVADWKYISLCPGCSMEGGDALYVYAWDGTNQADLSLFAPVSAFTLGGSSELISGGDVYGWASIYTDNGGWGYDLDHLTATLGDAIVSGEMLSLVISDAQFNYLDAYGGGVVTADGGNGSSPSEPEEPPPPTVSEFQLFIGTADLSAVVDEYNCGDVGTEPGDPTDPPSHGNGNTAAGL